MSSLSVFLKAAAVSGNTTPATNPNAWEIQYADQSRDSSLYWDISTGIINQNAAKMTYSVTTEESNPRGFFIKATGNTMFVVGNSGDDVNEYNLSTAWDVTTATYIQNYSVSSYENNLRGIFFKPDGTEMYVTGSNDDSIDQFTLSTAWDISTASHTSVYNLDNKDTVPEDIFFKTDGTELYMVGNTNNKIYQYSLSTAWDISTASYTRELATGTEDGNMTGIYFKSDGLTMYLVGKSNDKVYEYDLTTAWDISTASYSQQLSISSKSPSPNGITFRPDGSEFIILDDYHDAVFRYKMALEITLFDSSLEVLGNPNSIFFKPDGTKLYVIDRADNEVNEFNCGTAWDITTLSHVQVYNINSQEAEIEGVTFKSDGTKMFITGSLSDSVHEYSLSTAWDISTASYTDGFSVASQEAKPYGVTFKTDGTKMYVVGANRAVYEYSLTTGWDVSTASYSQNYAVSATHSATTRDIVFKSDGTKMYLAGSGTSAGTFAQFNLSTAWDVSTASHAYTHYPYGDRPQGIFVKPDGLKFYISGTDTDSISEWTIS